MIRKAQRRSKKNGGKKSLEGGGDQKAGREGTWRRLKGSEEREKGPEKKNLSKKTAGTAKPKERHRQKRKRKRIQTKKEVVKKRNWPVKSGRVLKGLKRSIAKKGAKDVKTAEKGIIRFEWGKKIPSE